MNDQIKRALRQIEENLAEELSAEKLSRGILFSRHHFHHLFAAQIGEPLMAYVKKRRLSLAGRELCETDDSILDIALRNGYSTHEGFTRAFKAFHGFTPTECRIYRLYNSYPKINIEKEWRFMQRLPDSTQKITKIISDVGFEARKLGELCVERSRDTIFRNLEVIGQEYISLSDSIADVLKRVADMTDMPESFHGLNRRFAVIKLFDDCAFRSNILAFNAALQHARTLPDKAGPFESIPERGRELARMTASVSNETTTMLNELACMLAEDALNEHVKSTRELLQKSAGPLNETGEKLRDEAKAIGVGGDSLGIIAQEILGLADVLGACMDFLDEEGGIAEAKKQLEECSFRLSILYLDGKLELTRFHTEETGRVKGIVDKIGELSQLSLCCSEDIEIPPVPTPAPAMAAKKNKVMEDILFQTNLLYYWNKTEYAKLGAMMDTNHTARIGEILALQNISFEKIKAEAKKGKAGEEISVEALLDMAAGVRKVIDEQNAFADSLETPHGNPVRYIAVELNNLASKIYNCAQEW